MPHGKKLHVSAGAQIINHLWPTLKKRGPEFAVGRLPDQRIQIAVRLLGAIVEAGRTALAVSGYPKRAGRGRSRAADLIGLLAHEHVEPFERSDQRRCHAGRTRTRNQQIDLRVGIDVRVHHLTEAQAFP